MWSESMYCSETLNVGKRDKVELMSSNYGIGKEYLR